MLKKLEINFYYNYNESNEVLSLPHSNLVELTMKYPDLSSDELISIARSKKKGFILTCKTLYEDLIKIIIACPSSIFK